MQHHGQNRKNHRGDANAKSKGASPKIVSTHCSPPILPAESSIVYFYNKTNVSKNPYFLVIVRAGCSSSNTIIALSAIFANTMPEMVKEVGIENEQRAHMMNCSTSLHFEDSPQLAAGSFNLYL
jgi:hypothetical protein